MRAKQFRRKKVAAAGRGAVRFGEYRSGCPGTVKKMPFRSSVARGRLRTRTLPGPWDAADDRAARRKPPLPKPAPTDTTTPCGDQGWPRQTPTEAQCQNCRFVAPRRVGGGARQGPSGCTSVCRGAHGGRSSLGDDSLAAASVASAPASFMADEVSPTAVSRRSTATTQSPRTLCRGRSVETAVIRRSRSIPVRGQRCSADFATPGATFVGHHREPLVHGWTRWGPSIPAIRGR